MKFWYEDSGEIIPIVAEKMNGQWWFHWGGETRVFADESSRSSKGQVSGRAKNEIHAPMPGRITKILKKEGESVKAGETVVVLEAMKMEYSLKAETNGEIKKIPVQEGQQVALGTLLIQL